MIELQLFGPFSVTDKDGVDRRPKLMKARAILAVLAATKGHRHSRSWFQNLLWQDRQHAQALSSMRSALTDIRRKLGPYSDALIADYSEVALNPEFIRTDLDRGQGVFLEGFDIANASNFEDWLRDERTLREDNELTNAVPISVGQNAAKESPIRLLLATRENTPETVTKIQCDTLVDCLAKSSEELGLAETVDGRGLGHSLDAYRATASRNGCGMILIAESAETAGQSIARLKVVDTEDAGLIWSKSVIGQPHIDLEDPATIAVAAEFVDLLAARSVRQFNWHTSDKQPPHLLAASGINHIFRLGIQNFETADVLFKKAYSMDRRGRYLAWRAFLRTFMLCEGDFSDKQALIEEGTMLSRRAIENEPHNSMVLALAAHVENMLHDDYQHAFELSARALELNRCNPLAWSSLGVAASFLGEVETGHKVAEIGARLAAGSHFGYQAESWASASGLLAGDLNAAKRHAERAHSKSPSFAPPLRYLTALYAADGQYERAEQAAEKLRQSEPDFSVERLKDDGYPADSLRKAKVLSRIPSREI